MTKILITGGAGFIGANFIHYILDKYPNYYIVNLDLLTYAANLGNLKSIEKLNNYKFVKGDISDKELIDDLFKNENFDIVVNFAAESSVDKSISDPDTFIKSNVVGTLVLLEASKKYNIKRYHQISTDEVYGDLDLYNKNLLFTEETPINPSSPYSASKASADMLVKSYFRTYNLPITISRCSNNYGPYQHTEKLIPLIIDKCVKGENIPIYGNGQNVRDWLYVYDHCTAIDKIIHYGKLGEIYNIGGNSEKTNIEVVKTIINLLGKSEDLITFVKDRAGHDLRYAIDASKLEQELNWTRIYDFDNGIKKTLDCFLSNSM